MIVATDMHAVSNVWVPTQHVASALYFTYLCFTFYHTHTLEYACNFVSTKQQSVHHAINMYHGKVEKVVNNPLDAILKISRN